MQIHELKTKNKRKKKKRIGRGGKRGTYSGKGMKGQRSRAGTGMEPAIRGSIKRYPKLRGYRFKKTGDIAVLNLGTIEKAFDDSAEVTPDILLKKGLIRRVKGRTPDVKILSSGELKKSLVFSGCSFSKQAEEKIKKAKGKIK